MSTARTVAVFAIVIGCFAVLYPRIFHPLVLRIFGMQGKAGSDAPFHPPGRKPDGRRPGDPDDIKSHIRPGPHPGLRAAAEMRQQQQQQAGTGRGMMGVVLPMYAVGIVLYLIYTIVKVFSKRQERSEQAPGADAAYQRESSYDQRGDKFTFGDDFDVDDDYKDFMKKKEKQRELEKLLIKADERHISKDTSAEFEMRQLQRRLEETEAQMARILQAMQSVTEKVETTASNMTGAGGAGIKENIEPEKTGSCVGCAEARANEAGLATEAENSKHDENGSKSSDSSPDTDSFEVVSKTESSSFSVLSTPTDEDTPQILTSSSDQPVMGNSEGQLNPDNATVFKESSDDDITVLSSEGKQEVENIGPETDILMDSEENSLRESSLRQRKLHDSGEHT